MKIHIFIILKITYNFKQEYDNNWNDENNGPSTNKIYEKIFQYIIINQVVITIYIIIVHFTSSETICKIITKKLKKVMQILALPLEAIFLST